MNNYWYPYRCLHTAGLQLPSTTVQSQLQLYDSHLLGAFVCMSYFVMLNPPPL